MNTRESQLLDWAKQYSFRIRMDKANAGGPIFERAKNTLVYDVNGKEYIDFTCGQMCAVLGHNHPKIINAIMESCKTIIHSNNNIYNVKEIELAKKLCEICPEPLKKAFFLLSGADSNDAAMAVSKRYTDGWEFASPHLSFHGLSGTPRYFTHSSNRAHRGIGPSIGSFAIVTPHCYRCLLNLKYPACNLQCVDLSFGLLDAESVGALAGVITEPLFSGGGVVIPPQGWLKRIQEKCKERGMLLILDEAQTGLAKMGTMFGFESEGVIPDILTLSKHFGGELSISAVVTNQEIEETVTKKGFHISHSQNNDPIGCYAAIASLDIIVNENMCQKAREIGAMWKGKLDMLYNKYEIIGDVRGKGLMGGIELVEDRKKKRPARELAGMVKTECLKNGLIITTTGGRHVIRTMCPFCTTHDEIERAYSILDTSFKTVLGKRNKLT